MKPYVFGLSTYYLMWLVAAVAGIGTGLRLAARGGFPRRQSFIALFLLAVAIVIGSKLQFFLEHVFFPFDDPVPVGQDTFFGVLRHGFRIPGGMLLLAAALPPVCRRLALPTRRFADAILPCTGIAILCIRIGCFLNGCCFGKRTDGWLGVSFPVQSRAYEWQLLQREIAWPATHTLPVYPLELYFAALGLAMYLLGRRWQASKQYDGQVWVNTYVLFFGATFALEFLRSTPLHLNLVLTASVVIAAVWAGLRARAALPAAARASS